MEDELFPHEGDEQVGEVTYPSTSEVAADTLPHGEEEKSKDAEPLVVDSDLSAEPTTTPAVVADKPKRTFPCRIWHAAGSLSARLVNSEPEIKAMLADGWTDVAPAPGKPEPLGKAEHAKRVVPHR